MTDSYSITEVSAPSSFSSDTTKPTIGSQIGRKVYHSFSGCDIRAIVYDYRLQKYHELANIQTLSYNVFREKLPVRSLGTTHAKGYTLGPRTIAGSLIFTVFNKSVLGEFLALSDKEVEANAWAPVLVDQIPRFDIVLLFASEYNYVSSMVIYNCMVLNEGQVMSVEDLITENTCQFVATHLSPLKPVADATESSLTGSYKTFKDLLNGPLYSSMLKARDSFGEESTLSKMQRLAGM
jgi:hypothetical protein